MGTVEATYCPAPAAGSLEAEERALGPGTSAPLPTQHTGSSSPALPDAPTGLPGEGSWCAVFCQAGPSNRAARPHSPDLNDSRPRPGVGRSPERAGLTSWRAEQGLTWAVPAAPPHPFWGALSTAPTWDPTWL